MRELREYKTWIFDCDGVVLDSNRIKTEAFRKVAISYGKLAADELVAYHTQHGGIPRYEKLRYLFETILALQNYESELATTLKMFGHVVKSALFSCSETEGALEFLRLITNRPRKIVVSGGKHEELVEVFQIKGLVKYFDEIHGSPATKIEILDDIANKGHLLYPVVFIGDSRADYEAARHINADFIFMSRYTEWLNWREYFIGSKISVVNDLRDLTKLIA